MFVEKGECEKPKNEFLKKVDWFEKQTQAIN